MKLIKYLVATIGTYFLLNMATVQAQPIKGNSTWSTDDDATLTHISAAEPLDREEEKKIYPVPFASRGNTIELTITNSSSKTISGLELEVEDLPEWVDMTSRLSSIGKLAAGAEMIAGFTFHLKNEAPVGSKVPLTFTAKDDADFSWTKTITLEVKSPTELEISQNYPNPFRSSTEMDLVLPAPMQVTVTVYDVLGRKVETVIDQTMPVGGNTMEWDATAMASGIYFCRIQAKDQTSGEEMIKTVKMMLVK